MPEQVMVSESEVDDSDREARIIELAAEQWFKDGEIEEDQGVVRRSQLADCPDEPSLAIIPVVSEGTDNGAYVRCWCWVDFAGTDLDKESDEDDDDE